MSLLLANATLADGSLVDVSIEGDEIAQVSPVGSGSSGTVNTEGRADADNTVDLTGMLLLAAPAEPHAHLDKALTADLIPNPTGDLAGAIAAWHGYRGTITVADYVERATAAAKLSAANGCTALRTHVDLGPDIGTTGVEALLQVKADLAPLIDIQLVGLVFGVTGPPGSPDSANVVAVLREALDMGLDIVGGVPHIEADPARAIDLLLELAGEFGRPIDLHADENLDADSGDLETLANRVLATGFEHGVVASHCVALGMAEAATQTRVAEVAAEAAVSVVALPQTNLYLQARGAETAAPRGLTALAALDRAGVNVAGGGDNLRDPFCLVGRGDPLETASLLVMAGHLSPAAAYNAVSAAARHALGLPLVSVEAGAPAELMAIQADSVGEAVAAAPAGRVVIHRGRIVS